MGYLTGLSLSELSFVHCICVGVEYTLFIFSENIFADL
jgi:hypothetical protein